MARKMKLQLWNPRTIARLIKEGRGQGYWADYLPWLTVRDFSSLGLSSRIRGNTTSRVHHLFSKHLELAYFYILDWSPLVTDIREQFPLLPLEETLRIAERLGVRHPMDPGARQPIVMTTDFLIATGTGRDRRERARTTKPWDKLTPRVLEKFAIEREYFRVRGIDWGVVTELELPRTLVANLDILHPYHDFGRDSPLAPALIDAVATDLTARMARGEGSLAAAAKDCNRAFGLPQATALTVGNYLVATQQWNIDLTVPYHPRALSVVRHVALRSATEFRSMPLTRAESA